MIKKFLDYKEQAARMSQADGSAHIFNVARLIELTRNLPVMEIPLKHINMSDHYDNLTLREMAGHMEAVVNADMSKPIILDEDGCIMDGRHRLIRAIFDGLVYIKAVRFGSNPLPDSVE